MVLLIVDLLQLRQDSALSSSNALSENARTSLRSAPIQSSELFGGIDRESWFAEFSGTTINEPYEFIIKYEADVQTSLASTQTYIPGIPTFTREAKKGESLNRI